MTRDKKITDKQLKKEIEKGKTFKEIALEYNYGYPSGTLSERAKKLGYKHNSRFTVQNWGGATISLDSKTIEKAEELSGVNSFKQDGKQKHFKYNQVVKNPSEFNLKKGDIVLRLKQKPWRKE